MGSDPTHVPVPGMDEIPVVLSHGGADKTDKGINLRVRHLKRDIENNRYAVDAPAVADAMLRKIRLLKQGGNAGPVSGAGRSLRDPDAPRGR